MPTTSELTSLLMEVLSRPPSEVDLRLKPEEELARMLGVGRRRLRNSLSALEQQGFLARRRGSGTYVRRVPQTATRAHRPSQPLLNDKPDLVPDLFFVDDSENRKPWQQPIGPKRSQKELHLELWKDLHSSPTVGQAVVDGIITQVSELSHQLTIHSFFARKDTPLSVAELRQKILTSPCDGYIVASRWSDLFVEALGDHAVPRLFYSSGRRPITHEPHLMLDTAEAVERGVGLLASEGYRRIGSLTIAAAEHVGHLDVDAYERAMATAGLGYRAIATSGRDVNESIEATLRLLDRDDAPEALYISDNFLLDGVVAALKIKALRPGSDLALITHGNVEHELPAGFRWSRIEFDLHEFGHRLVNELLRDIHSADVRPVSLAVLGKWQPGETHQLR